MHTIIIVIIIISVVNIHIYHAKDDIIDSVTL